MLQELYIQNYAIIDSLKIQFTQHLNIITGETGAGKSILMGALGLILGDRADTSILLDNHSKCIVEGRFKTPNKAIKTFFKENDLDEEPEILIRREISSNGKSRAFINDTPVTLVQLKTLSGLLVDLHRQFDTQELNNRDFQIEILDALAMHDDLLHEYQSVYQKYKTAKQKLHFLKDEQEIANKEYDYHRFLFNELQEANFLEGEIEDLESESKLMSNSEAIKEALSSINYVLSEGEEPILQQIKSAISKLGNIKSMIPSLSVIYDRMQSSYIELKDITEEIESANSEVTFSEERLNEINTRMDLAYTLLKKHHVQTTEELIAIKDNLHNKIQKVTDLSVELEKTEKEEKELLMQLNLLCKKISDDRKKQLPSFSKKVNQLLHSVGMPNAVFKVEMESLSQPSENGSDAVEFLFNANKTTFQPVRKVASGGELSRLMLIIKSLVAMSINLPTLIFDEIDTGISGEAAKQVGLIIKDLSANHQVLLITHQPQIAAKAFTHFFVFKEVRDDKVLTGVKKLNREERIHAIATMLAGDKPTQAAFENAREMIN